MTEIRITGTPSHYSVVGTHDGTDMDFARAAELLPHAVWQAMQEWTSQNRREMMTAIAMSYVETTMRLLTSGDESYDIQQAIDAKLLPMHYNTIRKAIIDKKLKARKIGKKYLIKKMDIDDYISNLSL